MKKVKFWYPIAAVLLGLSVSVFASLPVIKNIKAERAATKENIIKLDKAMRAALVAHDINALRDLLSDDFEIYTIRHGVFDKEKWVNEVATGTMSYSSFDNNRGTVFQGKQISNIVEVTGIFWNDPVERYPVEMSIRAVEMKDGKLRIKCMTVKDVS